MLSSLEALDEPLEPTSTVPRVGAFQPKAKPRARKPNASSNVAGKSKASFVDKIIPKPNKVTEIKSIVKENPLSPLAENVVGSQVIDPSPFVDSPIDVKTDVGLSAISIVTDPIEEKPVLDALKNEAIFSSISQFPEDSLLPEDSQLISPSNSEEDSHVSVPSVHEETIVNSVSLKTIEEIHQSTILEEVTLSIPSESNARDVILSPSPVFEEATRIAAHDNDEPQSTHDTLDASFPSPESNSVAEHTVAVDGYEKLQTEPRNSKRKPEAMAHCFTADVGEGAEDAYETEVSPLSKKYCMRGQQLQNGVSKPRVNEKDKTGFQNLEDLENGTDCVMNLDDRSNNQSKCKREKIPVRKPSNGYITVQHDFLDNRENCFVPNTNISPEGSGPINNLFEKKIDQQRGWRQKLKEHKASDSSTKMQNEVLVDRENPSVQKTNTFPDTEVVPDNSSGSRIIKHSEHSGLKRKVRKIADGSARTQQEVQVENSPNEFATGNEKDNSQSKLQGMKMKARNAADGSAIVQSEELDKDSINEFDIENNLGDQKKYKSKQKREKIRGQKAAENPAKGIQETLLAAHVSSNVETRENCFDAYAYTPLEDQEPDENAREKQRQSKRKASVNGKSLELSKKKFSHSTVRHRRRVEKHLLEMPEADLDPKKLKIKDLIRLAEAKEKIQNKEEAAKKTQSTEVDSNSNASGPSKEPDEDERASLAPQFKLVDGKMVLDEESLVVTHRDLNTDDLRTYRRVEESTSKLNYHTYMNRTPVERWSKSETELFYKAMQQFGTDFAMIQHLFPGRTRRQVKSKFKMEERKNPLQLADVLMNRPQDNTQFEKVIEKLKISPVAAEISNPNGKMSTSIDLEDITFENWNGSHEEAETVIQKNSTLEIPETQESEKMQEREKDSMFPEDISEIDKSNSTSTTHEDLNEHKEASQSPENASNEPIVKPKSLFSYQVGTSKPKSLFGFQL